MDNIFKVLGYHHWIQIQNNNYKDIANAKKIILFRPEDYCDAESERLKDIIKVPFESISLNEWPTLFFFRVLNACLFLKLYIPSSKIEKKFLILVSRTKGREYRSQIMDEFSYHGILEHSIYSWLNPSEYPFKHFHNKKTVLDTESDDDPKIWRAKVPLIPVNYVKKVEWNIVLEYIGDQAILGVSEKTVNAIYSKKPFIVFGLPGANKFLKQLGFDIFDDIIDYDFDNRYEMNERIQKFVSQVIKLKNTNHSNLEKRCEKNFKNIFYLVENKIKNVDDVVEDKYINLLDEYFEKLKVPNLVKKLWIKNDK